MHRTTSGAAAAALALVLAAPALALEAPKKLVDYRIQVSLDPKAKSLDGRETLRWTNDSPDRVPDLKFHLYWNAFRNNRSSFFKESGGQLRGDKADEETGWGHIDVISMTWDGEDLTKGFRFESPDDGNADDRTVLSVSLPRPVEPGQTIELQIAWKSRVPKVFARAGYVRDFFFLGQWFPKIGVYEHAGLRRRAIGGWNCHQYHANSEFYADWGDYRVEMTLPENFVVASAGAKVEEKKANGKKTLTYEQKSIHDFAWTADPRYVVKENTFDPAKEISRAELSRASKLLGRTPEQLMQGFHPVKLRYYMQPDHEDQWTRYDDAQRWALVWFGLYAFPYPYDQISIVDPPEDGTGAGGMEYQTLYTTITWKMLNRWPMNKLYIPEGVTIHEFGHGYWYGLLASNEFEESWMDEGINSFTEYEMVDRRYGYEFEFPFGVGLTSQDLARGGVASATEFDAIVTPSWKYSTGNSYGRNSYPRPATVINQIRRLVGEERFWRAFRSYAERWRFDHPASEDFFDSIQAAVEGQSVAGAVASSVAGSGTTTSSGKDHVATATFSPSQAAHSDFTTATDTGKPAPAFDVQGYRALISRTFYGTGYIDYRILTAISEKAEEFTGYDDRVKPVNFEETKDGKGNDSKDKSKADKDKKKEKKKDKKDDKNALYTTKVVVARDGEIVLPVDVLLTFENGRTYATKWDGKSKWLRLSTTYPSKLAKVEVDPERKIVLDHDPWNNARHLEAWKGPSASRKVTAYSFHLLEILFSSLWTLG